MSTTPVLGLTLPPAGETGWTNQVNGDFTLIDTAVGALQTAIAAGVVFAWKGPYSASMAYAIGNAVSYNGSSYIAIAASTGATPSSSPSDWQLFAQAGSGGIVWAGPWSESTAYAIGNAVSYDGSSYLAIAASTGSEPDVNPSIWSPLALGGTGPPGPTGATGAPGVGVGAGSAGQFAVYNGPASVLGDLNLTEDTMSSPPILSYAGYVSIEEGITVGGLYIQGGPSQLGVTGIEGAFADAGSPFPGLMLATEYDIVPLVNGPGVAQLISNPYPLGSSAYPGGFAFYVLGSSEVLGDWVALLDPSGNLEITGALTVDGAAPAVAAGKVAFGATTAPTATAGSATLPAAPAGFLEINIGGTVYKVPYYPS